MKLQKDTFSKTDQLIPWNFYNNKKLFLKKIISSVNWHFTQKRMPQSRERDVRTICQFAANVHKINWPLQHERRNITLRLSLEEQQNKDGEKSKHAFFMKSFKDFSTTRKGHWPEKEEACVRVAKNHTLFYSKFVENRECRKTWQLLFVWPVHEQSPLLVVAEVWWRWWTV